MELGTTHVFVGEVFSGELHCQGIDKNVHSRLKMIKHRTQKHRNQTLQLELIETVLDLQFENAWTSKDIIFCL